MIRPISETAPEPSEAGPLPTLVTGAIQRRDGWASRAEARRLFAATPFFRAWDPAALDAFAHHALYDAPDGQVRLKMPGIQEGVSFAEEYASAETFELLPTLDERVETHWVVAKKLGPR